MSSAEKGDAPFDNLLRRQALLRDLSVELLDVVPGELTSPPGSLLEPGREQERHEPSGEEGADERRSGANRSSVAGWGCS